VGRTEIGPLLTLRQIDAPGSTVDAGRDAVARGDGRLKKVKVVYSC